MGDTYGFISFVLSFPYFPYQVSFVVVSKDLWSFFECKATGVPWLWLSLNVVVVSPQSSWQVGYSFLCFTNQSRISGSAGQGSLVSM